MEQIYVINYLVIVLLCCISELVFFGIWYSKKISSNLNYLEFLQKNTKWYCVSFIHIAEGTVPASTPLTGMLLLSMFSPIVLPAFVLLSEKWLWRILVFSVWIVFFALNLFKHGELKQAIQSNRQTKVVYIDGRTVGNISTEGIASQTKRRSAWLYLLTIGLIYVFICLLMKHPDWIFSVIIQNSTSDLTGETPRLLASSYFDKFIFQTAFSENEVEQTAQSLAQAIIPEIPVAFLFSCIDSYMIGKLKRNRLCDKAACFCAGYVLQALIAVSCVVPGVWSDAVNKSVGAFISIWIVGGVAYATFCFFMGNENIHGIVSRGVSVIMTSVYVIFKEMVKLTFVIAIFSMSLYGLNIVMGQMGIWQTMTASSLLITIYYIVLNRLIDKIADTISDKFVWLVAASADPEYKKTFIGEAFCFYASALIILNALFLSLNV